MKRNMVITVMCQDQPGLVKQLSEAILGCGGNVEESRMARLGGEFAGLLLVSVDESCMDGLGRALVAMEQEGYHIHTRVTDIDGQRGVEGYIPHEICVNGADHEGIIHSIADYLAEEGANIEEMLTSVINAPVTGTPLFSMKAVVAVPPALSTLGLRTKMESVATDMNLDVEVRLLMR